MTPTTQAGKHFHRMLFGEWDDAVDGPKRMHEDVIAAIEAEARQQEREGLTALVEVLPSPMTLHTCWDNHEGGENGPHADGTPCPDRPTAYLDRAAVLSILRGEDS